MRGIAIGEQYKKAAKEGGEIAGDARRALEKTSGYKAVNKSNFLDTNPLEVELIPFAKNKVIFDYVGLATDFWPSLAPCPFGNGRSLQTQKFVLPSGQIYDFIFCEWYNS